MRKFLISSLIAGSLLVGGCASSNSFPKPTDPTFPAAVLQAENKAKDTAFLSTRVWLALENDTNKQLKNAREANNVAKTFKQYVETNNGTLGDFEEYARTLVVQNGQGKDLGLLLDTAIVIAKDELHVSLPNLSNDQRLAVSKAIVEGVTDGVINATSILVDQ